MKHRINLRRAIASVILVGAIVVACSHEVVMGPQHTELDALIDRLGEHYLSGDFPDFDIIVSDSTWDAGDPGGTTPPGNELWSCRSEERSYSSGFDAYPTWDPNAEVIWPGSALQGQSITRSTPDPIIAPRGPGKIVLNILIGADSSSCEVTEVGQAEITSCANAIIGRLPAYQFPANGVLKVDHITSEKQLQVAVKANASYFGLFKAKASFNLDFQNGLNKFLVSLNQSFYTLSFQRPAFAHQFVRDGVTVDDIWPFVGPGNPPVYISSVTYGRVFYLLVESSDSIETISASLNASFGFGGFGGGVSGSVKHVTMLANYRRQVYAYGGDQAILFSRIAPGAGAGQLDNWLEAELYKTGRIDRAMPLTYSVRSVRSALLVKNGVATDWTYRQCIPVDRPDNVPADAWYISALSEMRTSTRSCQLGWPVIDTWRARVGNDLERPTSTSSAYRLPRFNRSALNDHGGVVFQVGGSFNYTCVWQDFFPFNGGLFVNTDYTLMAVIDFLGWAFVFQGPPPADRCQLFLQSSSGAETGLAVGVRAPNLLSVAHDGHALEVPVSLEHQLRGAHVFTFRFSQTDGMSIYVDGELQTEDRTLTTPLSRFPGACLGLRTNSCTQPSTLGPEFLYLGDLIVFKKALTPAERSLWENQLRSVYGI